MLIIDDSPDISLLVSALIEKEGITTIDAGDGLAGLETARRVMPDLILLDVSMPAPDGFEVCRRLKADPGLREIPVIFLTGADSPEQRVRGFEIGAIDYVTKPFNRAELRARVLAALRTRQLMNMLEEKAHRLRDSEERFRMLAEDSSDLISRHLPSGEFQYASPAAQRMLGIPPAELLGQSILDLVHPEDRQLIATATPPEALRGGNTVTLRLRGGDGQYRWVEAAIHAVRDGSAFQVSCRDVTQRKQAEQLDHDRATALEMIAIGRPFNEITSYLTAMIQRHHPGGAACVLALSEGQLHVIGPSLPADFYQALQCHSLQLTAQLCSDASAQGQCFLTSEIATELPWCALRETAARHGYQFYSSRLIQSATHGVIGMVGVYEQNRPGDAELHHLLEIAASLISVASEHLQLCARLAHQASHDSLTGLPNRMLFDDRLRQAIALSRHTQGEIGLILFDIDHFKLINDTLGHPAGDKLLHQIGTRVLEVIRPTDTLARLSGDEFCLILPAPVDRQEAMAIARRIQCAIEPPFTAGGRQVNVSVSSGIALAPTNGTDAQALLSQADVALYRVKAGGRNGFQCFTPGMAQTAGQRVELESRLRRAIDTNELSVYYQPQVSCTGRIVGLEALIRWRNPELGWIDPATFIGVAEDCGLIVQIGAWVTREVCRQGQHWIEAGLSPVSIAVNVSAIQFAQPDFSEMISRTLAESGFDPRLLELEVTESSVMRDVRDTGAKLQRLSELGIHIAVDDFGTGYSSLSYLDRLPLHRLKIDRSFVKDLDAQAIATPARTAIVRAVTSLGHNLGLSVVAEGVERIEQFHFLKEIGCDVMQGYLFSPARPASEIEALLRHPAGNWILEPRMSRKAS